MPRTGIKIVITEASSGFGAAEVPAFADRGAQVWGTMRDAEGRNAGKKVALEAYFPRIAIAEIHAFTQPRHDALLKETQLDGVLGGTNAFRARP